MSNLEEGIHSVEDLVQTVRWTYGRAVGEVRSQGEVEEVMLYNSFDVVVEEVIPLLWF